MASRACLLAALVLTTLGLAGADARTPPAGTAMFVVRHDLRLCPSPMCGGYWVALANGARTRCLDGLMRAQCYVARASTGDIPEESLVRGAIDLGRDDLGELFSTAVYPPAGTAKVSGGFYRLLDNGIRCVRAPCFSITARSVNASTRVTVSSVDLRALRASPAEIRRAETALATRDGLYARGRFAATPDGGRVFRALRLYLRAPLPRA